MKQIKAKKDGWSRWQFPIMKGYLMQCCDCGLIHEMEFEVGKKGRKRKSGHYTWDTLDDKEYGVAFRVKRKPNADKIIEQYKVEDDMRSGHY